MVGGGLDTHRFAIPHDVDLIRVRRWHESPASRAKQIREAGDGERT